MSEILNILGSVGFNWHVALANFFNFLIILFLLNKFVFKKLGNVIDERQLIIEKGLTDASDAERALLSAQSEGEDIITEAKKEKVSILSSAEVEGKALASSITALAEEEKQKMLAALTKKEMLVQESVEKEFALKAPSLVAKLYKATLMKEMTEDENNAFIQRVKSVTV